MAPRRPTRAAASMWAWNNVLKSVDGRAYLDLQNLARRQHRPTDELHQLYALEGFLARLAGSPHAASLVLKGGVLLAAYDARRPTRDIDMQARIDTAETDRILQILREIAALPIDDGLQFDAANADAHVIRDEDESTGVRITMNASLSTAKLSLHVDVNVGQCGRRPAKSICRSCSAVRSR